MALVDLSGVDWNGMAGTAGDPSSLYNQKRNDFLMKAYQPHLANSATRAQALTEMAGIRNTWGNSAGTDPSGATAAMGLNFGGASAPGATPMATGKVATQAPDFSTMSTTNTVNPLTDAKPPLSGTGTGIGQQGGVPTGTGTGPATQPGAPNPGTGGPDSTKPMTGGPFSSGPPSLQDLLSRLFSGSQSGNENRGVSLTGVDPRLDALFTGALGEAVNRYRDPNGRTFYEGPTVAGLTPDEIAAQDNLRWTAGQMGGTAMNGYNYLNTLLGRATNPQDDPTLNAAISSTMTSMDQQATDPGGVFSTIRGNSLANGSYGGTRQGVMEGVAAGRLAQAKANTEAQMRLAGRTENINAAQNGINSMGQITSMATTPATLLGAVGGQNRDMSQRVMDDNLRRWGYNSTIGDTRLDQLFNRINSAGLGGYTAQSSFLSPDALRTGQTSTAQNVMGGLAGAGALISLLRNAGIF